MPQIVIEVTDQGSVDRVKSALAGLGVRGDQVKSQVGGVGGAFTGMRRTGIPAIDAVAGKFGGLAPIAVGVAGAVIGVTVSIKALKLAVDLVAQAVDQAQQAWAPYEQGMRNVGAVAGATRSEIAELSIEALELASATRFSPSQVTDGLYALASAGQAVEDQISSLPAVLDFAEAAQAELGLATELTVSTLANFDLAASQSSRVVDVYTAAIGASALNAQRLKIAMSQAGPAGASLGQTLEGTTAGVAILTTALGSGEKAGTGFRSVLSQLILKEEELGVKATDAAGNMRPLADIIADLEKRSIPATEIISTLGQEAGPALSILIREGSEALREMETRLQSSGQAAQVAGEQLDTLQGDLDILASKEEEFWVLLGQSTSEGSRIITQAQTEFWQGLVNLIDDNSELIAESFEDLAEIIETALTVATDAASNSIFILRGATDEFRSEVDELKLVVNALLLPFNLWRKAFSALFPEIDQSAASLALFIAVLKQLPGGEFALNSAIRSAAYKSEAEEAKAAADAAAELEEELAELNTIDVSDPNSLAKAGEILSRMAKDRADESAAAREAAEALRKAEEELKQAYEDRVAAELKSSQEIRSSLEEQVELLQEELTLRQALQALGGPTDVTTIAPGHDPFAIPEPDSPESLEGKIGQLTAEYHRMLAEAERRAAQTAQAISDSLFFAFEDLAAGDFSSAFSEFGIALGMQLGRDMSEEMQREFSQAIAGLGAIAGNVFAGIATDAELGAADWLGAFGSIFGPTGQAIGQFVGGYLDSRGGPETTGQLEFELGGTQAGLNQLEGGVEQINAAFSRIETLISGTIESTNQIEIKTDAAGGVWLSIGDVLTTQVDSVSEALDLATTYLLRTAEFSGVPEQVLSALERTSATTLAQLESDLAFAMDIARLDMGPVRAFFMDVFDQVSAEIERAIELGIDPDPLIKKAGKDLLDALESATSPEEHEQLAEEIRRERERLEQAIESARSELDTINDRIERFLNGVSRLPESIIVALMNQAADLEQLLAALEGQLSALPVDIPSFSGGSGGGGRRKQARAGVREQVEALSVSAMDPLAADLLRLGQIIPDLRGEMHNIGLSAEEAAALIAEATEAVEAMGEALVDDVVDSIDDLAPSAGGLGEALDGIDSQAADLEAQLLLLHEAGLLTADQFADLTARLEDNAAAAQLAAVEDEAEGIFLRALQFLGLEEEAARFQFELKQAELLIAIAELEAAQQKLGIELAIIGELGGLAEQIAGMEFVAPSITAPQSPAFRPIQRVSSAADDAARALEELERRTERANQSLRDLVDDLSLGELGAAVTPEQALAQARADYEATLAAAQGGDLEARERLAEVARAYLRVLEDFSPELLGAESPDILAALRELLGLGPLASIPGPQQPSPFGPIGSGATVIDAGSRFTGGGGADQGAGFSDLTMVAHQQLGTLRRVVDEVAELRAAVDAERRELSRIVNRQAGDVSRGTRADSVRRRAG